LVVDFRLTSSLLLNLVVVLTADFQSVLDYCHRRYIVLDHQYRWIINIVVCSLSSPNCY